MNNNNRKDEVRDTIRNFIEADYNKRIDMCTYGVEIETQCDMDYCKAWDEIMNTLDIEEYVDMDEYHKDLRELVVYTIDNDWLRRILSYHLSKWDFKSEYKEDYIEIRQNLINRIYKIEDRLNAWGYFDSTERYNIIKVKMFNKYVAKYLNYGEISDIYEIDAALNYSIEESEKEGLDYSEYEYDLDDILENHGHKLNINFNIRVDNTETVSDQSVSGIEIRTVGANTDSKLKDISREIFNKIDSSEHYIDDECSAHIHIKLGDIFHKFGTNLHTAIMEYLVLNTERLPLSVQQRIIDSNRWIQPKLMDGKYTWVHFHPQGTIEFRLFGNIDNTKDLIKCRDVALEALAYAYQIRFGDYERLSTDWELMELIDELEVREVA